MIVSDVAPRILSIPTEDELPTTWSLSLFGRDLHHLRAQNVFVFLDQEPVAQPLVSFSANEAMITLRIPTKPIH